MLHRRTHPAPVIGCFGCKAMSIGVTPSAMGASEPVRIEREEHQLRADLDAYKRLRRDGTQPRAIDGSADLEKRAESPIQIAMGPSYMPGTESRIDEAHELMADFG